MSFAISLDIQFSTLRLIEKVPQHRMTRQIFNTDISCYINNEQKVFLFDKTLPSIGYCFYNRNSEEDITDYLQLIIYNSTDMCTETFPLVLTGG